MKRMLAAALLVVACVAVPADAAMVTARWGVSGARQHPGTLKYRSLGKQGMLLVFDLSALPARAEVCSARLFLAGVNWKENGFDIVPAVEADGKVQPVGKPLAPAGPWYQWLDATEAARAWAKTGTKTALLWMRNARTFRREATVLEIAYEGDLPAKVPPQVTGVRALGRGGQVFVTFKEVEPWGLEPGRKRGQAPFRAKRPAGPPGEKEPVPFSLANWGDLVKKFKGDYYGPLPDGRGTSVRYRVYSHDKPITAANVGQARLLGEVLPGSAFNTRIGLKIDTRRKREDLIAIRAGQRGEAMGTGPSVGVLMVAVEPGKPVPLGTGVFVHTVKDEGERYYAVLTSVNGLTNTRDLSKANVAGPIRQRRGDPQPVLYKETTAAVRGGKYLSRWYSFWTAQPLSPWPARYDVVVSYCPDLLKKPAALHVHRSGWNNWPTPPRAHPTAAVHMSHAGDMPVDFRTGLHDSIRTIKGFDQGRWQPFHTNRQTALIQWMRARWALDPSRINVSMGAWGMMEIKHGHLYAMIRGWGEPELTKGFQCWHRARGIWGAPALYKGRPGDENPYVAANLTDWVLAHPEKELPFYYICAGGGAHYTEEGWPPFPRFCWAMMKSKQPFLFCTARRSAVAEAIRNGQLQFRRGQSLPAFANCSLDDNLGEGDLLSGNGWNNSQVNGWILWEPATIVDEPTRWEITLWVGEHCPLPEGTVDLTPRRCRKFSVGAKPRQTFKWTNTVFPPAEDKDDPKGRAKGPQPVGSAVRTVRRSGPHSGPYPGGAGARVIQRGMAAADKLGLVTVQKLRVTKARHRIVIVPAQAGR